MNSAVEWLFFPLMSIMLINVISQVVFRYIIKSPISWSEEFSIFLMNWGTFTAAGIGLGKGIHIAITFLFNRFPPKVRLVLRIGINLIVLFYIVTIVFYGIHHALGGLSFSSPALRIPKFWFFLTVPVCGVLLLLEMVQFARSPSNPE